MDPVPAENEHDRKPRHTSGEGPRHAAGALACEVERHSEAGEYVERRDAYEVSASDSNDLLLAREQVQPCLGKERGDEPDYSGDRGRDGRAGPRDLTRARMPPGADACADHRDRRGSESEKQRNEQIVEAGCEAVTRYGVASEAGDEA